MRTFFYLPPLKAMSGGMYVIVDLARHLSDAGNHVELAIQPGSSFMAGLSHNLPVTFMDSLKLEPNDRFIVPEGWPNALAYGLHAKAECCVYVQNWAFLHGHLPQGVQWKQLPVRMFAVSDPVALFIYETTGIVAPVIRPAVDATLFYPGNAQLQNHKTRIAWMPRKNRGLARQIQLAWAARVSAFSLPETEWVEIRDCQREEVGQIMRECDVFLATGFPEGFALPPLEAMACGCLVTGFAGMGGWDYMRQALPHGYEPPFRLRNVPWGANGFYAADGDALGAVIGLEAAVSAAKGKNETFSAIREAGLRTAGWYSPQRQSSGILELWNDKDFWANDRNMKPGSQKKL